MSKAPVKITKDLTLPETAGVYHRVVCMTGKNKGLCYYLNGNRMVMGRSNKADIQILDTQASREHVELSRVGKDIVLTDLGSQNGVVVNDLDVKQHKLKNGDKIIIGSTVYKYSILDIMPLALVEDEDDDEEEEEEVEEVKSKVKKSKAKPKKKNNLMLIILILAAAFLFLPSDESGDATKNAKNNSNTTPFIEGTKKTTSKKSDVEKEVETKVEAYIHRGRREAREGNYFRAMEEFGVALMLDPNSGDAAFHMNRAKQRLDEKIEVMFLQATKYKDSLKFHQALMTYCSVVKLLKDYPDDERFKEADKNVKDMATKLGKDERDNHCF
ncbi:FHA domain-containing protein [Bacteriovorax sp. Seq25_V]|uniref:FHA domain-containing protein n=1 Tax=Bacteriovorax sp. Seq25_V TaxID=1201288 RepID=UPI00038A0500|nr:FHA domain-containing protein [Bacteriovorax sp. Seq25_V]EQC46823.1 FHA domain protein [Bacteriovorax sp. Seq25_V]